MSRPAARTTTKSRPPCPTPVSAPRGLVGLGHAAKIRPQDLVGAIANETSLSGRQIGAIEITHMYSTVEIPKAAEAEVIGALQQTLIKGRKARVERYRPPADRPRRAEATR